jgi:uncharacterized HAD superfamily protein
MKIGIDIDGVLADFVTSYNALIRERTGIHIPPASDTYPDVWEYDVAAGLTSEQLGMLWAEIRKGQFWATLHALPGAVEDLQRLWELRRDHDIYFITSRPGLKAKRLTEQWLSWHGYPDATVLITKGAKEKALVAAGLELDVFVEDNATNLATIMNMNPKLAPYLIDRPYNRGEQQRHLTGRDYWRVERVGDSLDTELGEQEAV